MLRCMTVSQRKTAAGIRWRYDFEQGGQRYASPAIYTSKREAAREEKAKRKLLERGDVADMSPTQNIVGKAPKRRRGGISLAAACDAYWRDIAQHNRSAKDIRRRLDICQRLLGADVDIAELRFASVMAARETRRAEPSVRGKPLTGSAVNRDLIDTLRPALNHAALTFELALPKIDWGKLRLKESDELVREYGADDIERWADQLPSNVERLYLLIGLTYGARRGEMFIPAQALKRDGATGLPIMELGRYLNREGVWRESRKDGSLHSVTLSAEDAALLAAQAEKSKRAGARHIWTDEAGREISYYQMGRRLNAAATAAGIEPGRVIHGMRHHAVSAIVRVAGLAMGQRLAGHKQITTTKRYTHISNADLGDALAKAARPAVKLSIDAPSPADAPPGFSR